MYIHIITRVYISFVPGKNLVSSGRFVWPSRPACQPVHSPHVIQPESGAYSLTPIPPVSATVFIYTANRHRVESPEFHKVTRNCLPICMAFTAERVPTRCFSTQVVLGAVFSSPLFWTLGLLNVPAGVTQTGGRSHMISHPPSFCGACLNFSREKDSAVPFPRRP